MYRVLLPVDQNEARARAQVAAVLELPVAAGDLVVDVVHVHKDISSIDAGWAAGDSFSETFAEEMADEVHDTDRLPASVDAAVDALDSSGHQFAVHERSGEPAAEILAFASEHDSNAIVLGGSRRSSVGKVLFGSVVQAVILESDRPVTVVPESES